MLKELERYYGMSRKNLELNGLIVRHKAKLDKPERSQRSKKSKRIRKNQGQQLVLEREYQMAIRSKKRSDLYLNQRLRVWNKQEIQRLSEKLGLSRGQIYKWQWDRHNKSSEENIIDM